jgi:hypothetical protein
VLDNYNPKLVDKECFIRHYSQPGRRPGAFVEDICFVGKAREALSSLKILPSNKDLQKKNWEMVCYMQHDMPLGNEADIKLQQLKYDLQQTGNYEDMGNYQLVLDDLLNGLITLLNERPGE